jgi:hypothetical protein
MSGGAERCALLVPRISGPATTQPTTVARPTAKMASATNSPATTNSWAASGGAGGYRDPKLAAVDCSNTAGTKIVVGVQDVDDAVITFRRAAVAIDVAYAGVAGVAPATTPASSAP